MNTHSRKTTNNSMARGSRNRFAQFEALEQRALLTSAGWGTALKFLPPPEYSDPQGMVQPIYPLGNIAPYADLGGSTPQTGVTIELWVDPTSSGSLVEQSYQVRLTGPGLAVIGSNFEVPLIWIDSDGKVEAGLIDKSGGPIAVETQLRPAPITPFQSALTVSLTNPLSLRTSTDQPYSTGAPNPIVGMNSVMNSGWHEVALVATSTSESLYVDGVLQGIHAGSFGLSFDASIAGIPGVATPYGDALLGGTLIPERAKAGAYYASEQSEVNALAAPELYPGINYPYGYSGQIDEVRVWNTARTANLIQSNMDSPMRDADGATKENLVILDDFDGTLTSVPGIVPTKSSIPVDAYDFAPRLPGYRPFGLDLAVPFDTVQLTANVAGGAPFWQKVGLAQGDQIVVTATGQDGNPLSSGSFRLAVSPPTGAAQSRTVALDPLAPSSMNFTAGEAGTYFLSARFTNLPPGVTNVNLTYKVVPGASNSLLELLGYFQAANGSFVPAYQDPNLPQVSSIDASGFLNRAYWPILTNIQPPAGVGPSSEAELIDAYTAIYNAALPGGGTLGTKYALQGGFYNIVNSTLINASDLSQFAKDLNSLQAGAFPGVTPAAFTTIKSFLLTVTDLRTKALSVLDSYKAFGSNLITTGALQDTPGSIVRTVIASLMQNNTNQKPPTLVWPEADTPGFDVGGAFTQAALGLAPSALGAGANLILPGSGFIVEGLTTVGVEYLNYADSVQRPGPSLIASVDANAYSHISDVAARVQSDLATTGGNIVASFDDPTFRQVVMSNYGLLSLLANVPSNPFSKADFAKSSEALQNSIAYASWKQIVAAAYHWQVDIPTDTTNSSFPTYYQTGAPYEVFVSSNGRLVPVEKRGLPGTLFALQGGNVVTQSSPDSVNAGDIKVTWDPGAPKTTIDESTGRTVHVTTGLFGSAYSPPIPQNFVQVPLNATTQGSGSRFYAIVGTNLLETSQHDYSSDDVPHFSTRTISYQRDGAVGVNWVLEDSNGLEMSPSISQKLFGVGTTPVTLDPTGVARYVNGGIYYPVKPVPGAVTSWADAFFNWGVPTVGSIPGSLVPTGPISGTFVSPNGPRGVLRYSSNGSADVNYTFTFRPIRPLRKESLPA